MNELISGIKAVVFDLGNVIIELHYDRSVKRLMALTGMGESQVSEMLVTAPLLQQFEVGAISEDEFRQSFCDHMNLKFSTEEFDELWNGFLGEISKERLNRLIQVKQHYQSYVLSNTNSIHERCFNNSLKMAHSYSTIDELVDRAYYSHKVAMRKPDASIYELLLEQEGLQPNEVLFIDDRMDNIQSASDLGIRTFHNKEVDLWLDLPLI